MTAIVLVGLMVASALVLAITWIEPRVLGGPAWDGQPAAGSWDAVQAGQGEREEERGRLGQLDPRSMRPADAQREPSANHGADRRAA